ncbi:hypothetical protein THAOC_25907, partial [Thalassiosira oceanica]
YVNNEWLFIIGWTAEIYFSSVNFRLDKLGIKLVSTLALAVLRLPGLRSCRGRRCGHRAAGAADRSLGPSIDDSTGKSPPPSAPRSGSGLALPEAGANRPVQRDGRATGSVAAVATLSGDGGVSLRGAGRGDGGQGPVLVLPSWLVQGVNNSAITDFAVGYGAPSDTSIQHPGGRAGGTTESTRTGRRRTRRSTGRGAPGGGDDGGAVFQYGEEEDFAGQGGGGGRGPSSAAAGYGVPMGGAPGSSGIWGSSGGQQGEGGPGWGEPGPLKW